MNKVAIFCHGVPNLESNQPNADVLMHAQNLSNLGFFVKIVCVFNEVYQSDVAQEYYKKFNKKKNLGIHIIYPKFNSLKKKILNRIFLKLFPNLIDSSLLRQRDNFLDEFKPDLIINFFERAIELNSSIKIKKVNFLSIPLDLVEILRIKLTKVSEFKLSILNSIFFIILYKLRIKKLLNDSEINFISCSESFENYKKKKIKNLKYFFPLNRVKPKNEFNKTKKILMIGNLKSTFVIDALKLLDQKLVFELEYMRKYYPFEIVIIGKFVDEKKKYKNLLDKKWIKFKGWIANVDDYFKNSTALFVPSQNKLSVRTKILDAFSSGLPVVTFEANNFNNEIFKNNENIICAKNVEELMIGLRNILINDNFREYISKNSIRTYYDKINVNKTLNENINLIKKVL